LYTASNIILLFIANHYYFYSTIDKKKISTMGHLWVKWMHCIGVLNVYHNDKSITFLQLRPRYSYLYRWFLKFVNVLRLYNWLTAHMIRLLLHKGEKIELLHTSHEKSLKLTNLIYLFFYIMLMYESSLTIVISPKFDYLFLLNSIAEENYWWIMLLLVIFLRTSL